MNDSKTPSFTRPDPSKGVQADRGYADSYVSSHLGSGDDCNYRLGYSIFLLFDRVLPEHYSLLDVGCGTGGYHRMLQRYGRIVGVDFSTEMISAAEGLKKKFGLANIEYLAARFEDFHDSACFDAISLVGVYGSYMPWVGNEAMLKKAASLLNDGGLAAFSYVRPKNLFQHAKCLLFAAKTVLIRPTIFSRKLGAAGFTSILELNFPHAVIVLARKTGLAHG